MARRNAIRRTQGSRRAPARRVLTFIPRKTWRKKKFTSRFKKNRMMTTGLYVPGMKKKLNTRPELKYTTITYTALTHPVPNTTAIMWDPNATLFGTSQRAIEPPTVGTALNQFVGQQFNSLYAVVRFSIEVTADTLLNDYLRIMVARPKITPALNVGGTYPTAPAGIIQLFDTKAWTVMYDKTFGYVCNTGNVTKPRIFQFKIPLRQTTQLSPTVIYPVWERPPLIMWASRHGNQISCTQFSCRWFYRDP